MSLQILKDKCEGKLHELNLYLPQYIERLEREMRIIEGQDMVQYFFDCIEHVKKTKKKVKNTNHLLVSYLLEIAKENPLKKKMELITTKYAEFPDIDTDFEDTKRELVKDHLIERYGKDNVATIMAFGRAKAKNTIKDICRVKNIPFDEVNEVTKLFKSGPDEDTITDALNNYPEVRAFFNKYEYMNLKKLCLKLEGNVRQPSKHASGFVVSPIPLIDCVGLMKVKGITVTCWEEGIQDKELSKIGLIKFDLLGLNTISVIADTVRYIKERHDIDIDPTMLDINDVKVLKEFYDAHTVGIFQFEKPELRSLMKKIKVGSFSDISAINALNRPGPLDTGMDEIFWKVKNGVLPEKYLHDNLAPILKDTYTVILYQEQIIKVAQALAGYDADEADNLRRVLTKDAAAGRSKGVNPLEKLEKEFIRRCVSRNITGRIDTKRTIYDDVEIPSTAKDIKILEEKKDKNNVYFKIISCNVEVSDEIFHQIKSFANYGFNKCLVGQTRIRFSNFKTMKLDTVFKNKDKILGNLPDVMSTNADGDVINSNRIVDVTESGVQDVYLLTTGMKKNIIATKNHKIRTDKGWKELGDIGINDKIMTMNQAEIYWDTVVNIKYKGKQMTYDVSLADQTHPYFFANNIVVHNSHSAAYAYLAFESMFFKVYYPKEFMSKLMSLTPNTVDKKHGTNDFINYVEEAKRMKINILPPDINKSEKDFAIEGEDIRAGFGFLKGVANKSIDNIMKNRPFRSIKDFLTRIDGRAVNKTVVHALTNSGAFDCFLEEGETIQDRYQFIAELNRFRKNKEHALKETLEKVILKEGEVCGGEIFNSTFSIYNIPEINKKYEIDEKIEDFRYIDGMSENTMMRIFGRVEKFFEGNVGFVDIKNGNKKQSFLLWKTDLDFLNQTQNHPIKAQLQIGNIITCKIKRGKDYKGKKSFNIISESIEKLEG
jgi:DNA polymerase III alpha subunit